MGGTKWEEGFAKGGGVQQEQGDRGKGALVWLGSWAVCSTCADAVWMRRLSREVLGPDFGLWRARYGLLLESAGAD